MRRTSRRLMGALTTVVLLLLVAAPAVAAAPAIVSDTSILATEAGDQAPGPAPQERDAEGNAGAPEVHEGPRFARFVAAVLTIAAVGGVLTIGYLYFLLVKRPQSRQSTSA